MTILHQLPELCFRHQNNCDIQNRKTFFVFKLGTSRHATVCSLQDWFALIWVIDRVGAGVGRGVKIETYLSADRICEHHRFQACSGNFFTFRLVRFRNCLSDPEDMYSVINITCTNTVQGVKSRSENCTQ